MAKSWRDVVDAFVEEEMGLLDLLCGRVRHV